MKFKTATHLLFAAMIAFGVTSCGSDKNKTDSGSVANTPVTTTNTVTANPGQGALTKEEFYNEIANSRFDEASEPGLYSFPKNSNSGSNFDFDFCWGYEDCMEQQLEKSQYQVNSSYWRFLDSNKETVYRNFTANGLTYTAPSTDDQFGSSISSLRSGLLNIVNGATSVEKYDNYYGWTQVSSGMTAVPYNNDLSNLFGGNNSSGQRSKIFRFRFNNKYYIIDLRKALIKNPTAVY
jgi:hypothetical protein